MIQQCRTHRRHTSLKPTRGFCTATTAVHGTIDLLTTTHDEEVIGATIALIALVALGRTVWPLEHSTVRAAGRTFKIATPGRRYSCPLMLAVGADRLSRRMRRLGTLELQNLDGHSTHHDVGLHLSVPVQE